MRSKRVSNRRKQALPAIQAAFTFADVVVEATKRGLGHSCTEPIGESPAYASGQIFVLLGRNLRRQLRRLLAADDCYQGLRASQRRLRSRRNAIAKSAYALLVDTRKYLQGFYGYEGACEVLGLTGPTEREPRALYLQLAEVVWWARNRNDRPAPQIAGGDAEAEKCIGRLEALYLELKQVIDNIERRSREVEAAMLDQRTVMAEFDRAFKHSAGAIEAQLIQAGLPTLAATVRPGVGRRGRPLKQRPIDVHPDLVEQVRAQGLIELDSVDSSGVDNAEPAFARSPTEVGNDSQRELVSRPAMGDGSVADGGVSTSAGKGSPGEGIIEQSLHKRSEAEEKSRQPPHKRSGAEEKSAQHLHERSGTGEKAHSVSTSAPGPKKKAYSVSTSARGARQVVSLQGLRCHRRSRPAVRNRGSAILKQPTEADDGRGARSRSQGHHTSHPPGGKGSCERHRHHPGDRAS